MEADVTKESRDLFWGAVIWIIVLGLLIEGCHRILMAAGGQ